MLERFDIRIWTLLPYFIVVQKMD